MDSESKVGDILSCAREGCVREFPKKVHNQRFCSPECTRVYTNEKILAAYHAKRNRNLKNRVCSEKKCNTVLSIYNEASKCGVHERNDYIEKLRDWGWEIDEDNF